VRTSSHQRGKSNATCVFWRVSITSHESGAIGGRGGASGGGDGGGGEGGGAGGTGGTGGDIGGGAIPSQM